MDNPNLEFSSTKVKYKGQADAGDPGDLNLQFDRKKGELKFKASDVDLTGLGDPVALVVAAGNYIAASITYGASYKPSAACFRQDFADVFCLASEKEGWPNVVLEALACGVPVVATSVWGTPEIIPSPEIGSLVPWSDVPALAAALREALHRSWEPERLRAHALQHTWDRTAGGLVAHYEEILRERGVALPRLRPEEGLPE